MADIIGSVALALTLNREKFDRQVDDTARRTESVFGKAFTKVGALLASALAIKKVTEFGHECMKLGSNLAEVQNVVDVTFGNMNARVNEFAKNAIESFGLSQTVAKQYMGTLGTMAKALGFTTSEAYDMAESLTGLAGDVASFYNTTTDEAFSKLKGVFTGETEGLKTLGVVMNKAALDQYALANGFGATTDRMSEQEKVALRLAFVQDALAGASGDFARTAGGWANSTRVLSLRFAELKATLGQGFINLFTPLIVLINRLIARLQVLANYFLAFTKLLTGKGASAATGASGAMGAADAVGAIADNMNSAASGASSLGGGLGGAAKAANATAAAIGKAKGFLSGFDNLSILKDNSGSNGGSGSGGSRGGGGAGGGADDAGGLGVGDGELDFGIDKSDVDTSGVDYFYERVKAVFERVRAFLDKYGTIIKSAIAGIVAGFLAFETVMHWGAVSAAISTAFSSVAGVFATATAAIQTLWGSVVSGEGLLTGLQAVFGTLTGTAVFVAGAVALVTAALVYLYETSERFRDTVAQAVQALVGLLQNLWNNVLLPLVSWVLDMIGTIVMPLVELAWGMIVEAVDVISSLLLSLWTNILAPVADFLVSVLASALRGVIEIWQAWKPAIEMAMAALLALWNNVLSPCIDWLLDKALKALSSIGGSLEGFLSFVLNIFNAIVDFLVGVFTLDVERAWNAIKDIFAVFADFLEDTFGPLWEECMKALGKALEAFEEFVSNAWKGIKDAFAVFFNWLSGTAVSLWDKAVDALKKVFEEFKAAVIAAWEAVKGAFDAFASFLQGVFSAAWNNVIGTLRSVLGGFKDYLFALWDDIKSMMNGLISFMTGVFAGGWSSAWSGIVQSVGSHFNGIVNLVKLPLNAVIGLVNSAIRSINKISVKIPDWVPAMGGSQLGFSIATIPALAAGGYVGPHQPRLALIGDNPQYGEIVSPENKIYDIVSKVIEDHAGSGNREDYVIIINLLYEIVDILKNLGLGVDVDRFIRILDKRKEQLKLMTG